MFGTQDIPPPPRPGSHLLARNTAYNLAGYGVPFIVAFIAMPILVRGLGTEKFGILTLAWMVVGYFTLFDLGIGRATTKFVAEAIARGETYVLPQLVWTSLGMLVCLGIAGGSVLAALSPMLVSRFFTIPAPFRDETVKSFYLLAAVIPVVIGTAGTRGILEAQQRFGVINAIKIPVSATTFAAPLLVLPFSHNLFHIVAVLVVNRLVEFVVYLYFCLKSIPGLRHPQLPHAVHFKKMLGFGGWLTITNIVGPFLTYMDRFIIGGILTVGAVAYYATPYDFVTRLAIIPGSLLSVIFPELSVAAALDANRFAVLYDNSIKYILLVLTPAVFILIVMSHSFLQVWLGPEFATQSALVLQILAAGIFVNSVAQVPFCALQAMGRTDITAKIHLIELPLYLAIVWGLVLKYGITGAALAWLLRVVFDAAVLYVCAHRLMMIKGAQSVILIKAIVVLTISLLLTVYILPFMQGVIQPLIFIICFLAAFAGFFRHHLWTIDVQRMLGDLRGRIMKRATHEQA